MPVPGFAKSGSVDMLKDLIADWPVWKQSEQKYDPVKGLPLELGYITTSSPPIVVNDVLVVGNSAEQGYHQTRVENVPGDILGYDAKTGKFLWKFHVIPRPGEFGHETWENDAWRWTGDVSSWAPMSADPARGLVYIPTNGATIDYFGGFRPGDNLFSTSIIALDVKTGKRVWHQQLVKHDIWNYDTPTAPMLLDVNVGGRRIPGIFQITKQSFVYSFNRHTGEPIWPIEMRPVPAVEGADREAVEGPALPDQARAVRHAGPQGVGPHRLHARRSRRWRSSAPRSSTCWPSCSNRRAIAATPRAAARPTSARAVVAARTSPARRPADPATGIIFVASSNGCSPTLLQPAKEKDTPEMTGKTLAEWVPINEGQKPPPPMANDPLLGIPDIFKGPFGKIVAIDMNTGEHLWKIPHGDMAQRDQEAFRANPLLKGVDQPRHQLGPPRPPGAGGDLDAAARHRPDRRQQAAPVRHRQEDRQARRLGRDGAARRLRPDDLPAPGQAVHRRADQRRLHGDGAAVAGSRLLPHSVRAILEGRAPLGGARPFSLSGRGPDLAP